MPVKQRQRAKKAITHAVEMLSSEASTAEAQQKHCRECLSCCCHDQYKEEEEKADTPSTELTPEMQRASQAGWSMIKAIIFPALPAILQDLWVHLELVISTVAFILGLLDLFPIESSHAYSYSYFVLATISMILALIDGFIYFFQLGSCARCIRDCRGKSTEPQLLEEQGETLEENQRKCCHLSEEWKETLNTWFEFGRNLLSELLLYPLLMFDLFDFIIGQGYIPEEHRGRINFSLFVIGGFYLILSVYIMRILIVAGSIISLTRIPNNGDATSRKSDTFILVRFCAHILGQIGVHLMIILVIATKINNENGQNPAIMMNGTNMTTDGSSIKASPFLITAIVLGWIIPLAGVFAFFVVNYYWMKEFSIGFWLNMTSLLQGESFAETVFGENGMSTVEEKVQEFIEDSQYKEIKKQLIRFKSTPVWIKFFYPARIPITAISGLLYDILLLMFIACLMLTYENGSVRLVVFTDDNKMTAMFVVSIIVIIVANIQALVLLNVILLMVIAIFAMAAVIAAFLSPLLLLVYFPTIACLGFTFGFIDTRALIKHKMGNDKSIASDSVHVMAMAVNNDMATGMEMDTLEMNNF
jgi:hypothetical protein